MIPHKSSPTLYAPAYYPDFRCIAERCRHSCCVDWAICIDDATLEKYRHLGDIMNTVIEDEDGASFALAADGRCPHLTDGGLCRIILEHGEDSLSDICRNHPRFINDVGGGRMEIGLGLVCEEACRLILTSEAPFSLIELDAATCATLGLAPYAEEAALADFDPLPIRDRIIALTEAPEASIEEKTTALQAAFDLSDLHTPDEWLDRFLALEMLAPTWEQALRSAKGMPARCERTNRDFDPYYARLLTYFVYRHVSVAESDDDLRARLGFALLSVDMIRRLFEASPTQTAETLMDMARRYSAEIEYSEDNTDELIFAFECAL